MTARSIHWVFAIVLACNASPDSNLANTAASVSYTLNSTDKHFVRLVVIPD